MAAPKRTKSERAAELAEMALLLAQGWTEPQLAKRFNLSPSVIHRDVVEVRRTWHDAVKGELVEHRAEIVARLDFLWREVVAAWELSKEDRETTTTVVGRQEVRKIHPTGKEEIAQRGLPTKLTKRMAKGRPDYHYAEIGVSILAERSKVLGVYEPATVNVNIQKMIEQTAAELGMPAIDLVAEMEEEFARAWAAAEGQG